MYHAAIWSVHPSACLLEKAHCTTGTIKSQRSCEETREEGTRVVSSWQHEGVVVASLPFNPGLTNGQRELFYLYSGKTDLKISLMYRQLISQLFFITWVNYYNTPHAGWGPRKLWSNQRHPWKNRRWCKKIWTQWLKMSLGSPPIHSVLTVSPGAVPGSRSSSRCRV